MKRVFSVLAAVLLAFSAGAALAEDPWGTAEEPAPAEEPAAACAHEHTETYYYFDYPVYSPVDEENHLVSGPAAVNMVCLDCGAVLSVTMAEDASEIRPHVFRGSRCALCGWEDAPQAEAFRAAPSREEEVFAPSAGEEPEQNYVSLTGWDLEQAGDFLVIRTGSCDAALIVQTRQIREAMERSGGFLTAEIVKPDDRHISTSVRLYDAGGAESVPGGQVVSLRVYGNYAAPLSVAYTGPDGTVYAGEAGRVDDGGESYWSIPWLGNGTYELIQ